MEVFDILEEARQGTACILMKGNGEVIAQLDFLGTDDFPWICFRFRPLEAWDKLGTDRNIFSGGQELKVIEVIESRIKSIQRLDLWLATADEKLRVGDFIFSIRDNQAYFRSYPRGKSIRSHGGQ